MNEKESLKKVNSTIENIGDKLEKFGKRRWFGNTIWVLVACVIIGVIIALVAC